MKDEIRDLLKKDPFEPFRIVVTSGKEYEVKDPQAVALGATELGIYPPGSDIWQRLRLNQIVSIESAQTH